MIRTVTPAPDFPRRVVLLALAQLFFLSAFSSQISDIVSKINIGSPHPGEPLRIEAELINAAVIDRVEIAYRSFGQTTFKMSEMSLVGNSASLTIPAADLAPPFLEYYMTLHKRNGEPSETYPMLNPAEHPLKIDLQNSGEVKESSIIILSPEQNDRITPEDLYISYSLLRADSTINPSAIKTYIDGNDVSGSSVRMVRDPIFMLRDVMRTRQRCLRIEKQFGRRIQDSTQPDANIDMQLLEILNGQRSNGFAGPDALH